MKVLCIADIHGDVSSVNKAAEYAKNKGIRHVLILGDFPAHGAFRSIELSRKAVLDTVEALNGLEIYAIPGNCDLRDSPAFFEELGINLHEKKIQADGWTIAGFGGSNTTPFDTPYEMAEEEMYQRLKDVLGETTGDRLVLAFHCPPKDTNCDKNYSEMHVGSSSVRKIIEEYQPRIALCSHIHEAAGTRDAVDGTLVVNIGPLGKGRVGLLTLKDGMEINLGVI